MSRRIIVTIVGEWSDLDWLRELLREEIDHRVRLERERRRRESNDERTA